MSFNAEDAARQSRNRAERGIHSAESRNWPSSKQEALPLRAPKSWLAFIVCVGLGGLLILYFFAPTQYGFYPRCLFHASTGLSCPGCGSLRAMHHLLHGQWAAALHYHALLIVLLPVIPGALIWQVMTGRKIFLLFQRPFWIWSLLGVIVTFSILRNLPFGPLAPIRL
jgi:hypothetical protein